MTTTFDEVWVRPIAAVGQRNCRGNGWSEVGLATGDGVWPELGVQRGYAKRQQHYFCHPAWNAFRPTPTLRREQRFLQRAKEAGVRVPAVRLYAEGSNGRAVLLLGAVESARRLRDALTGESATQRAILLDRVATILVRLHRARILHGAVYDRHLLIDAAGDVALIDFEKARRASSRSLAAIGDLERFFRRTPVLTRDDRARIVAGYPVRDFPLLMLWWRVRR